MSLYNIIRLRNGSDPLWHASVFELWKNRYNIVIIITIMISLADDLLYPSDAFVHNSCTRRLCSLHKLPIFWPCFGVEIEGERARAFLYIIIVP